MFLDMLQDLAECRDEELVRLKVLENYSVEKADRDLDERLSALNDQYRAISSGIREKFLKKLEDQAEHLRDKNSCEISSAAGDLTSTVRRRSPAVSSTPVSSNRQQRPRRSARGGDAGSGYESARSEISRRANGTGALADLFPDMDAYGTDVPAEPPTDSAYTQPAYNKAGNRNPKFLPILTQAEVDADIHRMKRRPE
jgi:hypothetical protein